MDNNKISVNTPWGELTAIIGGDPDDYPEIFVYIKRKDGGEIDLVCASMDKENNKMDAFLYGDTSTDCWTHKYSWSEDEIKIKEAE